MNQTIWKFRTIQGDFNRTFSIEMPKNTELLYVDLDMDNTPCIWGLVYPEENKETRQFELFGTGHIIPNDMGICRKYIGSYRYQNGEFIGHVFERTN
jgi:hypothetical protein